MREKSDSSLLQRSTAVVLKSCWLEVSTCCKGGSNLEPANTLRHARRQSLVLQACTGGEWPPRTAKKPGLRHALLQPVTAFAGMHFANLGTRPGGDWCRTLTRPGNKTTACGRSQLPR